MCNPFTTLDTPSTGCACDFNYKVGLSQEITSDNNQISIEIYNLQWDFQSLSVYSPGALCRQLFIYSYDISVFALASLRSDVGLFSCNIEDVSESITYTDSNGNRQKVDDYRTRIVISQVTDRAFSAFMNSDLSLTLNSNYFFQDCNNINNVGYTINSSNVGTNF